MSKTLLLSFPPCSVVPADAPPTLLEVETAYAALASHLQEAAQKLEAPRAKTIEAILQEARKPRL